MDVSLAREAKAIIALALRNGPLEDLHAGRPCPTCHADRSYSRITDTEMKQIIKNAVNQVYKLLQLRQKDRKEYERQLAFGDQYTKKWDAPEQ